MRRQEKRAWQKLVEPIARCRRCVETKENLEFYSQKDLKIIDHMFLCPKHYESYMKREWH